MAYTRRQELMCTEAQMIAKPNVVLRENEVIYIKMNDGTLRQKIGDGVTTIINLPFTQVFDGSVVQTTGDSETAVMSQKAVTEELDKKFDKAYIVHELGDAEDKVLSQKAANEQDKTYRNIFANALKETAISSTITIVDGSPTDNVNVFFKNKNLLNHNLFKEGTFNGVTITIGEDGKFILNGTATAGFSFYATFNKEINERITMSAFNISGTTSKTVSLSVDNEANVYFVTQINVDGSAANYTAKIDTIKGFYIWIDEGTVLNNLSFKWQVEYGFVTTPYKEPIDENTEVTITTYGKNLLNHKLFKNQTMNGVTLTVAPSGEFILSGTATKGFSFGLAVNQKYNTNVTVSAEVLSGATSKTIYPTLAKADGESIIANIYANGNCAKYTGYIDSISSIYIWIDEGTVFDWLRFTWQIEVGSYKTKHEIYKEGENITTTIANGASVLPITPNMTILSNIKDLAMCAKYSKDTASIDNQKNVVNYNLPVLRLYGDTRLMSKDNAVDLTYVYRTLKGTCSVKWQGSSSLYYPKKNYTIKFDRAFEAKTGWGNQKKYCAKANWIDVTHARNNVSAILWGQTVKSRANANASLSGLPNAGAIDGFPIIITINDNFEGLYTFNIPKDGWMFGMGDGTNEAILCADKRENGATNFSGTALCDGSDFELEYVSDEDNADWVATSVNRMITACRNSDGTDLDAIGQYLDWGSVIDYYIFTCAIMGIDMTDKNYLLSTFDGIKWFFSAYDLDSTWGLNPDGAKILPSNYGVSFQYYTSHRAMKLVYNYKKAELIARYKELRNSVLCEDNVSTVFANFIGKIPEGVYISERQKWVNAPLTSVNTIHQITDWYRRRITLLDAEIESMQ